MAGLYALSINPSEYQDDFLEDAFWGIFYQQHLGEEYAGLASRNQDKLQIRTHRGLFRATFSEDMVGLEGTEAIGYCGTMREPVLVDSKLGEFVGCFSGNLINRDTLIDRFKSFGHSFAWGGEDIEVIVKLIAQGEGMIDGIKQMTAEIEGAYALLLLNHDGIYAACSPDGHWPLIIGEKKGAVAVASESGGFPNRGFTRIRDLEPGEIILMKNGNWEVKDKMPSENVQFCSFLWVYTAFPNAVFKGITASLVRKRLNANLARKDIERGFVPDVVIPVPDSGRFHAIGYHQEFCRQMNEGKIEKVPVYDEALLKYPYAGRSFTPSTEEAREKEANIKLLPSGETYYRGLKVVVCDDSLVRGVQTRANLVPKLRSLGVKEIHFRISNPELRSHCPWGKTTKRGETLAHRMPSKQDRIEALSLDPNNESLEYNTIEDLVDAIGYPQEVLCVDCGLDAPE